MSYKSHMADKQEPKDVPIALQVPPEIAAMLENAKKATGRTKKHLLSEAIRAKYSKYLAGIEQAA